MNTRMIIASFAAGMMVLTGMGCDMPTKVASEVGVADAGVRAVNEVEPTQSFEKRFPGVSLLDKLHTIEGYETATSVPFVMKLDKESVPSESVLFQDGIAKTVKYACYETFDSKVTVSNIRQKGTGWTFDVLVEGPFNWKPPVGIGDESVTATKPPSTKKFFIIDSAAEIKDFGYGGLKYTGAIPDGLGWYVPLQVTPEGVYAFYLQEAC